MPRSKHRKKPARSKLSRRFSGPDHLYSSAEDQRMSEVLLEFIKPYRALAYDDAALEKLIGLGVVAWNVALLPSSEREDALNDLATNLFRRETPVRKLSNSLRRWLGAGGKAETKKEAAEVREFKEIVYEMVEHKLRRFARNRRFIMSYHTEIKGDDIRLFVASTSEGVNPKY
jgi:hypothetical protein